MGWCSGPGQGPSPCTHGSHSFTLGRAGEKKQTGPGCSPAVGSRERLHSLLNLVLCFSICPGQPGCLPSTWTSPYPSPVRGSSFPLPLGPFLMGVGKVGEQREGLGRAHRGTRKGRAPHIPPSLVKVFFFFFFAERAKEVFVGVNPRGHGSAPGELGGHTRAGTGPDGRLLVTVLRSGCGKC